MGNITPNQINGTRSRFYRIYPSLGGQNVNRREVYQAEFLTQLDPSGHSINDPSFYENIIKKKPILDNAGKEIPNQFEFIEEEIERVSISLQSVILSKHLTHIGGENIKFILHNIDPSEKETKTFIEYKQGWLKKNMETAKYEFMRSVKATGDGALCGVLTNGEFSYRVYSVLKGDKLHPIYDFHGKLRVFGRSFSQYDYEKEEDVQYMAVWDDKYYTLLCQDSDSDDNATYIGWNSETFLPEEVDSIGGDGWRVKQAPVRHGFSSIPIEYLKNEMGACWSPVQPLIDKLEMALSQLFENNKAYAFRIMVIKGGVNIIGDLKGHARAMAFEDKEGSAEFMNKADASNSFELQLENTLKFIEMGSFSVFKIEKVSGDLPGVTIKILYSPAIEQGINDRHFFNNSIDNIVKIFKEGYGIEKGSPSDYAKLDLRGDIKIYVHQNESETMNNLAIGIQSGYTSIQTAVEESGYSAPDELTRLSKEREDDLQHDLRSERAKIVGDNSTEVNLGDGMNPTNLIREIAAK